MPSTVAKLSKKILHDLQNACGAVRRRTLRAIPLLDMNTATSTPNTKETMIQDQIEMGKYFSICKAKITFAYTNMKIYFQENKSAKPAIIEQIKLIVEIYP